MMRVHTLPLAGSLLLGVLLPMSTVAYVTPDQVLMDDAFTNNFIPPPSTRSTDEASAYQNLTAKQRREQEQAAYFAAQREESDETLYGAAGEGTSNPELTDVLSDLQQTIEDLKNQQDSEESKRNQRILDRIANQQETLHGGAPLDGKGGCVTDGKGAVDGKGGCINSGAPLNESGAGTWAAIAFGCMAVFWTLRKATKPAMAAVPQTVGTGKA
jgi:hypothetical protein